MIQIPVRFILTDPIDNMWTLIQVVAWRWTGDEAHPASMMP